MPEEMAELQILHETGTEVRRNNRRTPTGLLCHGGQELPMPGFALWRKPVNFHGNTFEYVFDTRVEGVQESSQGRKLDVVRRYVAGFIEKGAMELEKAVKLLQLNSNLLAQLIPHAAIRPRVGDNG